MDEFREIEGAPAAVGPYSIAVGSGNLVFLSGQIGLDASTGKLVPGGIEAETTQVLKNISCVLKALGLGVGSIVKATIFLTNLKDFQTVNKLYGDFLGDHRPARSTIQVAALPLGAVVEIEAIVQR